MLDFEKSLEDELNELVFKHYLNSDKSLVPGNSDKDEVRFLRLALLPFCSDFFSCVSLRIKVGNKTHPIATNIFKNKTHQKFQLLISIDQLSFGYLKNNSFQCDLTAN
jgi:hypothetical protein